MIYPANRHVRLWFSIKYFCFQYNIEKYPDSELISLCTHSLRLRDYRSSLCTLSLRLRDYRRSLCTHALRLRDYRSSLCTHFLWLRDYRSSLSTLSLRLRDYRRSSKYQYHSIAFGFDPSGVRTHDLPHPRRAH